MTRIFYDTEFRENGRTIELISIGMIREDTGDELYLINREAPYHEIVHHSWLRQNVLASLPILWPMDREANPGVWLWDEEHPDAGALRKRAEIADEVRAFILGTPDPQLWAWFAAYDHVACAWLFGPMIDLPDGCPMHTCDLVQEAQQLGLGMGDLPPQPAGLHNALADARHNLVRAQFLDGLTRP